MQVVTNVSGVILLPNLVQVTESIYGSVVPLAMFFVMHTCESVHIIYLHVYLQLYILHSTSASDCIDFHLIQTLDDLVQLHLQWSGA